MCSLHLFAYTMSSVFFLLTSWSPPFSVLLILVPIFEDAFQRYKAELSAGFQSLVATVITLSYWGRNIEFENWTQIFRVYLDICSPHSTWKRERDKYEPAQQTWGGAWLADTNIYTLINSIIKKALSDILKALNTWADTQF